MLGEKKTLGLVEYYELFRNPVFVKGEGHFDKKNNRNIYTVRVKLSVNLLGRVTLGTAYKDGWKNAFPVLLLNESQVKILLEKQIDIDFKERKHPTNGESYICIPNRSVIERIVSM